MHSDGSFSSVKGRRKKNDETQGKKKEREKDSRD